MQAKLWHAAAHGDLELCRSLVESASAENGERAELINAVDDEEGYTVLHLAADGDHPSIIQWLLSSSEGGGRAFGFSMVVAKLDDGRTAMHVATRFGHLECCQALVEGSNMENGERAALLNAVCDNGWTVLHWAAYEDHPLVVQWILSNEEGGGCAAGFNSLPAKTNQGWTALHLAAANGYLECCQALVEGSMIDNGERAELLNAANEEGRTALHLAARQGHSSIIQWLLSSSEGGGRAAGFTSSSVISMTVDSRSALHLATEDRCVDALNALLSGCSPAERLTLFLSVDKHGWTPLHIAARNCNSDVIRELLLHHPETQTIVDARDHRGMTALHRAVIGGIDEESRKEWHMFDDGVHIARPEVISALLIAPKKQDDDVKQQQTQTEEENSQAAMTDPNLAIKIEQ